MLLFPAAILTISDESDRDFMKHLYINHAARMFRVARALTPSRTRRTWLAKRAWR